MRGGAGDAARGVTGRVEAAARAARARAGDSALAHPRHLAVAAVVAGLLLGGAAPAALVAAAMLLVAFAAVTVPLVRRPAGALALAAAVALAAAGAQARTAALARTDLRSSFGATVSGDATLLSAPRPEPFGGRRALARFRGEPVLLRLPAWTGSLPADTGDVVAVRGRLREPDRTARTLRAHAVLRATGVRATGRRRGGVSGAVDAVRRRAQRALGHGPPSAEAGLLRGMVLGQDEALPDDLRDAFRAAGLSHLTAASGANVMLLAALAIALASATGVPFRARWTLVLALIALYIPLAGAGPSIQRAGIMGAATVVAALAGRPASRWYALLLAAAVTLGLDPRAASDAGWQLSFAAVAGIALLASPARDRLRRRGLPPALAEAVAVTLAATIATAPLIAVRFDRTSLVSLPANVLATPAVAPVMWLGMVAAAVAQVMPAAADPLVALAALPAGYLAWLGTTAAALPGAEVAVPAAAVTVMSALAAVAVGARGSGGKAAQASATGAAAAAAPAPTASPRRPARRRAAVALAVLAAVATLPAIATRRGRLPPPPAGVLRVTALDVGQGDATLLQAGGRAVLVDAGPQGGPIVARLRSAGVRRLDMLVVSHPAADHLGGAPAVLAAMPVGLLLDGRDGDRSPTSVALDAPLRARHVGVVPARAGQRLTTGPLALDVRWPPTTPRTPGADPNDRAIVAEASAFGRRVLLTADAESPVVAPLDLDPVDVLKVGHHGSADPGLAALLERLRPRVALVEVGRRNLYGHPAPATMRALAVVPTVLRTDRDGSAEVELTRDRVEVARRPGT